MNAINLRTVNVGDKLRRRDGEIVLVYETDTTHMPVRTGRDKSGLTWWHYPDGRISEICDSKQDIVEVLGAIKFQAGKLYRTRSGRKAFVAAVDHFGEMKGRQVAGFVENCGAITWTLDGRHVGGKESFGDLVAEWAEPRRVSGFLNVDANGIVRRFDTRAEADHPLARNSNRIACIQLDVLEGQGLEGEAGR
ncbi:hypothetical protein [Mesorhizobium sp. B2-3-10]|uniref:hypothetical protein n=1 Tax=Mesorhizobium sp. B2-3-10 TaxID=2589954 RepID=UPI00112DF080|nr:hypothetical protein [Mesorhizobium sp. B2-3-10]TPL94771.1 hypothetical protein FJ943_25135 [Mesorhizobium sp. B2-3-10]